MSSPKYASGDIVDGVGPASTAVYIVEYDEGRDAYRIAVVAQSENDDWAIPYNWDSLDFDPAGLTREDLGNWMDAGEVESRNPLKIDNVSFDDLKANTVHLHELSLLDSQEHPISGI
ncbi:hypothetical protein AZH53_00635 [Methanomicrobiaceae archaeon CYW5]|uniref:hypothetical protein n=1 Tax=Methanovulcanius yangii TaxID=1789227 RepID=UPI0029CA0F75|nr:hypothetical protein [Methanovulcanius yangii]MBT8506936.1 hypothetical protein [Methanovulcanius yangii]